MSDVIAEIRGCKGIEDVIGTLEGLVDKPKPDGTLWLSASSFESLLRELSDYVCNTSYAGDESGYELFTSGMRFKDRVIEDTDNPWGYHEHVVDHNVFFFIESEERLKKAIEAAVKRLSG